MLTSRGYVSNWPKKRAMRAYGPATDRFTVAGVMPGGSPVAGVTARGALLSIVGQSASDEAVMSFWTAMQRSAVFGQPTVTQLRRDNGSIFFEMTAVLPGPIVGADAGDGR
jgi:hypothetical protein